MTVNQPTRCRVFGGVGLALWLVGLTSYASAQPLDLRTVRDPAAQDVDFTWVHWFETQGRPWLDEAMGDRPLPWDTPASRRWRGEAVGALIPLLDDPDASVRGAAALSLARAGHLPVLDRLLDSVEPPADATDGGAPRVALLLDEAQQVRRSAWLALGLLDTAEARDALAAEPTDAATEADRAAQTAAIGLLSGLDDPHARWLIDRLNNPDESMEVQRWCVWSLRQHDDLRWDPAMSAVLERLPSTFLIGEVLLNAGYVERRGGSAWAVQVLRYYPEMRDWPGYRDLSAMPAQGAYGSTPRRLAMETRVAAALTLAQLPTPTRREDLDALLDQLRQRLVAGNSAQRMDFNRGFDALAYFMHCDAQQRDLDLLYDLLRGFAVLPPDDPEFAERSEQGEALTDADRRVRQSANEVRGFAALSAGLLIRRATPGTALSEQRPIVGRRPIEIERLKRRFGVRLMRAVANEHEPISYRAACALALGLTGDPRYRDELAAELGKLRGGDEFVLGCGLLSLALLGDERAAEPARRYVTRPGRVGGADDVLGRRMALRAIAVLGDRAGEDGRAALRDAWGRHTAVGMDVAQATARAGLYDALPGMIEATASESARWRYAAALSIGIVFDRASPSRLSNLITGMNPTMSMRPHAAPDSRLTLDPSAPVADTPPAWAPDGWPMRTLHAPADPVFFLDFLE